MHSTYTPSASISELTDINAIWTRVYLKGILGQSSAFADVFCYTFATLAINEGVTPAPVAYAIPTQKSHELKFSLQG